MALVKKVVLDRIEIDAASNIGLRLSVVIVDGKEVAASHYHRFVIEPGVDLEQRLGAVEANLGYVIEGKERVRALLPVVHTKEVVEARARLIAAAEAAERESRARTTT